MKYIVAFLLSFVLCFLLLSFFAVIAVLLSPSDDEERMLDDEEQAEYLREWKRQQDGQSARKKES